MRGLDDFQILLRRRAKILDSELSICHLTVLAPTIQMADTSLCFILALSAKTVLAVRVSILIYMNPGKFNRGL